MKIDLSNKIAVITGSSRGIGATTAYKLASAGANIVINYPFKDEKENALKIKKNIKKDSDSDVLLVKGDVSDQDEAQNIINKTIEQFDKIDILVNNAGITRDNLLLRMKENEWDQVIDVNLKGVYNCTKAAMKNMMKQETGKIINLASVVGIIGNAGQANYSASKAGVIGFTKSIARELSSRNINVNAVAPGFIQSPMTDKLADDVKKDLLESIPLNKFGNQEDVANTIVFLASKKSDYITGQVINIDGGMAM